MVEQDYSTGSAFSVSLMPLLFRRRCSRSAAGRGKGTFFCAAL